MKEVLPSIKMGVGLAAALAVLLLLAACGSVPHTETVTVQKIERCPIAPPEVQCPAVTDGSIEELEDAYIDCREADLAWREAWEAC